MGTLTISLSDEVEKKLRDVVEEMYGSGKGAIQGYRGRPQELFLVSPSKDGLFQGLQR